MRCPALLLLLAAAACSHDLPTPPAQPASARPQAAREQPQLALVEPAIVPGNGRITRSVFTYREQNRVEERRPSPVSLPSDGGGQIAVAQPQRAAQTTQPPLLTFPYRYIGRFGPEREQLAAFVADGEITLAKAGDVLAGRFLVRAIGIETVELAVVSAPDVTAVRCVPVDGCSVVGVRAGL